MRHNNGKQLRFQHATDIHTVHTRYHTKKRHSHTYIHTIIIGKGHASRLEEAYTPTQLRALLESVPNTIEQTGSAPNFKISDLSQPSNLLNDPQVVSAAGVCVNIVHVVFVYAFALRMSHIYCIQCRVCSLLFRMLKQRKCSNRGVFTSTKSQVCDYIRAFRSSSISISLIVRNIIKHSGLIIGLFRSNTPLGCLSYLRSFEKKIAKSYYQVEFESQIEAKTQRFPDLIFS